MSKKQTDCDVSVTRINWLSVNWRSDVTAYNIAVIGTNVTNMAGYLHLVRTTRIISTNSLKYHNMRDISYGYMKFSSKIDAFVSTSFQCNKNSNILILSK